MSIGSGVRLAQGAKKQFYYDFRSFLACLCGIRTISATGQGLCQDPDNIAQWKFFCVRTILDWADTDLLVGFQGSCHSTELHCVHREIDETMRNPDKALKYI